MILYDYFRSSAAYRVRIALNLKGLTYKQKPVSLAQDQHKTDTYKQVNPQGLVPAIELDDGTVLTQSLAICEYLDEIHPQPALLPGGSKERARVRALAALVACDMHPVNNLRILKYLIGELGASEDAKLKWYRHWIAEGFLGLEAMLHNPPPGAFCPGDAPPMADVCLVTQVFNARRFECDLSPYPTLSRIADRCNQLPAFADAHPDKQPDRGQYTF